MELGARLGLDRQTPTGKANMQSASHRGMIQADKSDKRFPAWLKLTPVCNWLDSWQACGIQNQLGMQSNEWMQIGL